MDDKGKKPSLALIIAAAKKKPGDSDDGEGEGYAPSPECVDCVRHFFEAGADGDYEAAASALSSAFKHIDSGDEGESEPAESME